ncbi:hypothetical protein ACE414_14005 [Alteromonas macleodii]|uniref:hypothetical protein n=1 Tax=Alteromonas macleodii TaxID=28108 RepID=UPI003646CF38
MKTKITTEQIVELISTGIRHFCKEHNSTHSEAQRKIEKKARTYFPNYKFTKPTIISDFANGKRKPSPKEILVFALTLGYETDFFEVWIENEIPYPLNEHLKKSYIEWIEKANKQRRDDLTDSFINRRKKYSYFFEMESGDCFEIPHGDLTMSDPYFKEVDKKKKSQESCTADEFERHMLSGGRTRTVCLKKDDTGKTKKQYNMYSIHTKGVKALKKRQLGGSSVNDKVIWSK